VAGAAGTGRVAVAGAAGTGRVAVAGAAGTGRVAVAGRSAVWISASPMARTTDQAGHPAATYRPIGAHASTPFPALAKLAASVKPPLVTSATQANGLIVPAAHRRSPRATVTSGIAAIAHEIHPT
jgi:hypothetical protein